MSVLVSRTVIVTAIVLMSLSVSSLHRVAFAQEATPADAATTTDWPMFRGNPARTGAMPGMGPEGAPVELWRFQADGSIASTPAVAAGVVYVGCDCHTLYAVDAATGEERWHVQQGESFATNPAVVDGVVYASNGDGNLYALDASDGTTLWQFAGSRSLAGPAVARWRRLHRQRGGHALGPRCRYGEANWQAELGAGASRSPAVAEGIVAIGDNDGIVHAVDIDEWR